eukprot:4811080-Pleurochrysis_carterae.AAC.1
MEQHSLVILLPARRLLQALLDLVSDVDELLARGSDAKGAAEGVVEVDADAGRRDERARQDREEETQLQRGEEAEQVLVGGDQKGDNDRSAQQAEHHPMYSRKSGLRTGTIGSAQTAHARHQRDTQRGRLSKTFSAERVINAMHAGDDKACRKASQLDRTCNVASRFDLAICRSLTKICAKNSVVP